MSLSANQDLQATQQIISLFEKAKDEAEQSIDRLPGAYLIVNREGVILRCSKYYADLRRLDEEAVLFTNIAEIFPREVSTLFMIQMRDLEAEFKKDHNPNKSISFEMPVNSESIGQNVFLWQIKVFPGAASGEVLFYVFGQDVTELRVKEKQLNEIFQSIPVGILTCRAGGEIDANYSKFAEVLFGPEPLAGQRFFDRVFKPALKHMKESDSKGAFAFTDSIGQSQDVYELLALSFPKIIFYPDELVDGGGRYISISYQPIVLAGQVDRILLMLTDYTKTFVEQKNREQKAKIEEKQLNRILEVRGCVIDVVPIALIEVEQLIPKILGHTSMNRWSEAANDLHSLKGNCRLAGFRTVASMAHDVEALVIKALDGGADASLKKQIHFDLESLATEWGEFKETLNVMSKELGIQRPEGREAGDLKRVKDLFDRYNELMYSADKVGATLIRERIQLALETKNQSSSDFIPLLVRARAAEVAQTYGKTIDVRCTGSDFKISAEAKSIISECLIHLVSNAVAHGIETPEDRTKVGKGPAGLIQVRYWDDMGFINIEIEDDGRGLNEDAIRRKGVQRGLISLEQSLTASSDDLANLIFEPGFSTEENVNEVAGRGVGLSAIRDRVRAQSGAVVVRSKGQGLGTCFTVNFDTVEKSLAKRLAPLADFLAVMNENLEAMTKRKQLDARIQVDSSLTSEDIFLYCDVGKVSLSLLTLIGSVSQGGAVTVKVGRANDLLTLKIDSIGQTANSADYLDQFPEFELSKRACERFLRHHAGAIKELETGLEVTFGFIIEASRIPEIPCYIQTIGDQILVQDVFQRISRWAGASKIRVTKVKDVSQAALVIGSGAKEIGVAAVDLTDDWSRVKKKFIEAVERKLGII